MYDIGIYLIVIAVSVNMSIPHAIKLPYNICFDDDIVNPEKVTACVLSAILPSQKRCTVQKCMMPHTFQRSFIYKQVP